MLRILTYHRIADPARDPHLNPRLISATPEVFAGQMRHLAEQYNVVRLTDVLEAAGVKDVLTKSLGTNNPINVVRATMNGLENLVTAQDIAAERGVTLEELGVR